MSDGDDSSQGRQMVLTVLVPGVLVLGLVGVVLAACGGMAAYGILAMLGGVALVGCLHYWLWGQKLERDVAGEREEDEIRRQMEDDRRDELELP